MLWDIIHHARSTDCSRCREYFHAVKEVALSSCNKKMFMALKKFCLSFKLCFLQHEKCISQMKKLWLNEGRWKLFMMSRKLC